MKRMALAGLAATVALGATAGCGSSGSGQPKEQKEQKMASVSGNCALKQDQFQLSPISADVLEETLGGGDYRLTGAVAGQGTSADPMNGLCRYQSVGDGGKLFQRMELSVSFKGALDGPYETTMETLRTDPDVTKIAGGKGYVRVTSTDAYGGGEGEAGSGVLFVGDAVYTAQIIAPAAGVDGKRACEQLVTIAAKALAGPLDPK